MDSGGSVVTLLGSGNSLGVYVPAVQLSRRLALKGVRSDIVVLENLYLDHLKAKVPAYREAFHADFAVAKKSAAFARDISGSFDEDKVERLLRRWERERRTEFVALTGFWLPILHRYRERRGADGLKVDLLHLDAGTSVSYIVYRDLCAPFRSVRFLDPSRERMELTLAVTDRPPIPWAERAGRFTVHGGGWGIGTYQRACGEMAAAGLQLNALAYYDRDLVPCGNIRYYRNDPDWSPWQTDGNGEHGFPPLARIEPGLPAAYFRREDYPPLFDVLRDSAAIVTKPGGYSLFESLAAATPLVLLEPFAKHEEDNARYWIERGFGIRYDDWRAGGYAAQPLARLHENLLQARADIIEYGGMTDAAENEPNVR